MLKCLMKYEWVKLRRDTLPIGKGIMLSLIHISEPTRH